MPMKTARNLFNGVNPLLQSWLQSPGFDASADRTAFHNAHVNHIADALNTRYFLPQGQYIARNTQGLQIRIRDEVQETARHYEGDVNIFRTQVTGSPQPSAALAPAAPTWANPVIETVEVIEDMQAVAIYQVDDHRVWGEPVAQIELLSPSNKPGGAHYAAYRVKRHHLLAGGIPLIEIDYLHESHSPVQKMPQYPDDPEAHPYYVAVSDPRPTLQDGLTQVYGFDVDEPIPTFILPLHGPDQIAFALDPVYQYTFEVGGWGLAVDYEQRPARLMLYRPTDQQRIEARLLAARQSIADE